MNQLIFQWYYSGLIEENQSDQKLFGVAEKLVHVKTEKRFPVCDESPQLTEGFVDFFVDKITKVRSGLQSRKGI